MSLWLLLGFNAIEDSRPDRFGWRTPRSPRRNLARVSTEESQRFDILDCGQDGGHVLFRECSADQDELDIVPRGPFDIGPETRGWSDCFSSEESGDLGQGCVNRVAVVDD
jgi:hypothetical protein